MACENYPFYIESLSVVDSTNSYARRESERLWKEAGACEAVVVRADKQTAGRGQRGNVWLSNAKENLLVTIMVRPRGLAPARQFELSRVVALAVRAAMNFFGIEVQLKWPNDIYVGTRKLAGILVEVDCCGSSIEQAVIGVGLNINQEAFEPMDKVPVSMKMLTGEAFSLDDVLSALLDAFSYYYSMLKRGEYSNLATDYKNSLMGLGKQMRFRSSLGEFDALVADVCESGHLCLQLPCGEQKKFAFKEVELLL